ncbi:MAG: DHHA1 domain-containing protein, partial [Desulfovibrionaceae bacterium]
GGLDLAAGVQEVGGVKVLAAQVDVPNPKVLREQADDLKNRLGSGVICLIGADGDGKVNIVLAVTDDLTGRFKAGQLIKTVAGHVGGGGGGRPDMAQAGGTNPAGIDAALAAVRELVAQG